MSADSIIGKLKPEQLKEIVTSFMEFDQNENGCISSEEMKECLRRSNVAYKDAEVLEVIKSMDSNRDGTISFEEYLKFMARMFIAGNTQAKPKQTRPKKPQPKSSEPRLDSF